MLLVTGDAMRAPEGKNLILKIEGMPFKQGTVVALAGIVEAEGITWLGGVGTPAERESRPTSGRGDFLSSEAQDCWYVVVMPLRLHKISGGCLKMEFPVTPAPERRNLH
jgi:hypothetical protein